MTNVTLEDQLRELEELRRETEVEIETVKQQTNEEEVKLKEMDTNDLVEQLEKKMEEFKTYTGQSYDKDKDLTATDTEEQLQKQMEEWRCLYMTEQSLTTNTSTDDLSAKLKELEECQAHFERQCIDPEIKSGARAELQTVPRSQLDTMLTSKVSELQNCKQEARAIMGRLKNMIDEVCDLTGELEKEKFLAIENGEVQEEEEEE